MISTRMLQKITVAARIIYSFDVDKHVSQQPINTALLDEYYIRGGTCQTNKHFGYNLSSQLTAWKT